jgi:predicted DNA-binding WGR domain protein
MTAIHLARIDADKNMSRFYKLDVQPTLFGEWSLVKEWGRIGRPGTCERRCTALGVPPISR